MRSQYSWACRSMTRGLYFCSIFVEKVTIINIHLLRCFPRIDRRQTVNGSGGMQIRTIVMLVLALLAVPALAGTFTVEGLASPAWVERAGTGERLPLQVGMALDNKDRVQTGRGSRALLRMADGSAVKLGEDAVLALDD